MKNMLNFILCLPPVALAVDLWINAVNLLLQFSRQSSSAQPSLSKNLPLALEDIQMIQVLGNFGMTLIVSLGILSLVLLNYRVSQRQIFRLSGFFIVGLLIVAAYTLPGSWTGFWASVHIFTHGSFPLSLSNPWHATVALFIPYTLVLLLIRIVAYFRQNRSRL